MYYGVFAKSTVENVSLPSTLKRIEHTAFYGCKNLRELKLPERLEYIGIGCFYESGLESIEFPSSVRTVCAHAFYNCKELERVKLNEGLEALGEREIAGAREEEGFLFAGSGLTSIVLPSTLKEIPKYTF